MSSSTSNTSRTLWTQALEHAKRGSEEQADRLLLTVVSVDRQQDVAAEELALVRCLIALRRKRPAEAECQAQVAVGSATTADMLRRCLEESGTSLPTGSAKLLRPILARSAGASSHPRKRSHQVLLPAAAITSFVVALGAGSWMWLKRDLAGSSAVHAATATSAPRPSGATANRVPPVVAGMNAQMSEVVGKVLLVHKIVDDRGITHRIPGSSGTAFAVGHEGVMVTNRHVVETDAAEKIELARAGLTIVGSELIVGFGPLESQWEVAQVQHISAYRDIAILKVNRKFPHPLVFAPQYKQGDEVRAWGFPGTAERIGKQMNTEGTVERAKTLQAKLAVGKKLDVVDFVGPEGFDIITTRGIISGIRNGDGGKFVQTDATVHHGNSGGPLVNDQGQVIGIVSSGLFAGKDIGLGVNVAIPWETFQSDFELIPSVKFPR